MTPMSGRYTQVSEQQHQHVDDVFVPFAATLALSNHHSFYGLSRGILVKTVLEYMEGGEVRWKDEDDRPILAIDNARSIFRDVVLGLEYRK